MARSRFIGSDIWTYFFSHPGAERRGPAPRAMLFLLCFSGTLQTSGARFRRPSVLFESGASMPVTFGATAPSSPERPTRRVLLPDAFYFAGVSGTAAGGCHVDASSNSGWGRWSFGTNSVSVTLRATMPLFNFSLVHWPVFYAVFYLQGRVTVFNFHNRPSSAACLPTLIGMTVAPWSRARPRPPPRHQRPTRHRYQ